MDQPNGHPCPECGAPRHTDRTPTCACARRTADALRDARTAEAAAAEDFDPLRIRPYVDLDGTSPDGLPEATKGTPSASGTPRAAAREGASADTPAGPGAHPGAATPSAHGASPAGGPAAHGTPVPGNRRTAAPQAGYEGPGASDATMTFRAITPNTTTPTAPAAGGAAETGTALDAQASRAGHPADTTLPGAETHAYTPGTTETGGAAGTPAHAQAPHTGKAPNNENAEGTTGTRTAPHAQATHPGHPADTATRTPAPRLGGSRTRVRNGGRGRH
ncbi:hypothetical protein GA0115245_10021, partial [Streptomyces sp. di188]